jgi:predicted nucleic acid-binding protein
LPYQPQPITPTRFGLSSARAAARLAVVAEIKWRRSMVIHYIRAEGYNEVMATTTRKTTTRKNGAKAKPAVSKLGRELRRISEKIAASGEKMLTRRELEREVANRRGGGYWAFVIRTFLDSGVLIAATRSMGTDRERALQILEEADRVFLTSPFIHLEVVPKAIFYRKLLEQLFYEKYFGRATWFRDIVRIEGLARTEAARRGLGAMDALHLAAARLTNAEQFITTEKPNKAIHRSSLVKVVYLFS